jgi:hypothetical protein
MLAVSFADPAVTLMKLQAANDDTYLGSTIDSINFKLETENTAGKILDALCYPPVLSTGACGTRGMYWSMHHVVDSTTPYFANFVPIVLNDDGTFRYERDYTTERHFPDSLTSRIYGATPFRDATDATFHSSAEIVSFTKVTGGDSPFERYDWDDGSETFADWTCKVNIRDDDSTAEFEPAFNHMEYTI